MWAGPQPSHLPAGEGLTARGLAAFPRGYARGELSFWPCTGAHECQGHSVHSAQRVEGRDAPFLSPVPRAPLCSRNGTQSVSLEAPSSPPCPESDPLQTRFGPTPGTRAPRLCLQGGKPAAQTHVRAGMPQATSATPLPPQESLLSTCPSRAGSRAAGNQLEGRLLGPPCH